MFLTVLVMFVHYVIMQVGELKLAKNEYQDIVSLTVGSTTAIYVWWFIAKNLEHCLVGRVLALIGKESLYVMMFYILGFFICNSLMVELGVFHVGEEKGLYTYVMSGNWLLLLTYVSFGIFVPLSIIYSYRNMTITMKTLFHKINDR